MLFIKEGDDFKFVLKTTNFSEDGGNQIKEIKADENGFVIVTTFPDGGFFESHHYISFTNKHWVLTHTVYKTASSNQEDAFIYVCDVLQKIVMSDAASLEELKSIPNESEIEKICLKQNN